ncbi:hypothetical protein AKO1_004302 [Acrasis kona]|uniref:Uncharacterized protein n=1 Tax=Acrasis kona TaxID=1008807 RepID=A0AAW2Z5V7_9EUKA
MVLNEDVLNEDRRHYERSNHGNKVSRQFGCPLCQRHWWKTVYELKPVARCYFGCDKKYDAIPREYEFGKGYYKCGVLPAFTKPPIVPGMTSIEQINNAFIGMMIAPIDDTVLNTCNNEWTSPNCRYGLKQKCQICGKQNEPYKLGKEMRKRPKPVNKEQGYHQCEDCLNTPGNCSRHPNKKWSSEHSSTGSTITDVSSLMNPRGGRGGRGGGRGRGGTRNNNNSKGTGLFGRKYERNLEEKKDEGDLSFVVERGADSAVRRSGRGRRGGFKNNSDQE